MKNTILICLVLVLVGIQGCTRATRDIERPEKIVSKRQVIYDLETYKKLAELWRSYYHEFPSEDAYANWMYAARYASDPKYESLLKQGVQKYPANPVLLYLYGMKEHGKHDDLKGQHLLEKAIILDPTFLDPWFALVIHYMDQEPEKTNFALRKLLKGGAVSEEIMDYVYNMLVGLDENAILITNGDNDTYPGWILQRLLNHRPDVNIVNRSLLNTDWYPFVLIKEGVPRFITHDGLMETRDEILNKIKTEKIPIPSHGPYSDTLIVRIIESAAREGRQVYFAATLFSSSVVQRYKAKGQNLGLVTLVTPTEKQYPALINKLMNTWINDFRTGGLDSWSLRYAGNEDAGRKLMLNYAAGIISLIDSITAYIPEYRVDLFNWYRKHLLELIPQNYLDKMNQTWCRTKDMKEIQDWCRDQGYVE